MEPRQFRLLCSATAATALGGSESSLIQLESEVGARIRVLDDASSEDKLIVVSVDPCVSVEGKREEEEAWTAEQRALVRVYEKTVRGEVREGEDCEVVCRIVVSGFLAEKMRREISGDGVEIRVLARDEVPAFVFAADDSDSKLIQVCSVIW